MGIQEPWDQVPASGFHFSSCAVNTQTHITKEACTHLGRQASAAGSCLAPDHCWAWHPALLRGTLEGSHMHISVHAHEQVKTGLGTPRGTGISPQGVSVSPGKAVSVLGRVASILGEHQPLGGGISPGDSVSPDRKSVV